MPEKSSIFDMIGPVMIGPSSSHTAGVVRIGRAGRKLLGGQPERAEITFYNSFARTYEGHGSDRAVVGGLLDYRTDDERIREALDHAESAGLEYSFRPVGNASAHHPNTLRLKLWKGGDYVETVGVSRGGGLIRISEVNGYSCNLTASQHTLIVENEDRPGKIAFLASLLTQEEINVGTMTVSRLGRNQHACMFVEMDSAVSQAALDFLQQLRWVRKVIYIPDIDT